MKRSVVFVLLLLGMLAVPVLTTAKDATEGDLKKKVDSLGADCNNRINKLTGLLHAENEQIKQLTDTLKTEITDIESKISDHETANPFGAVVWSVLISLALTAIGLYFGGRYLKNYFEEKLLYETDTMANRISELRQSYFKLKDQQPSATGLSDQRLAQLEYHFNVLQAKINQQSPPQNEPQNKKTDALMDDKIKKTEEKPASKSRIHIYASVPNAGGVFTLTTTLPDDDSLYEVELESEEARTAKFWIYEGSTAINPALNAPESYLRPACTIINEQDRMKAKRIKNIEPGLLEKTGSGWLIREKAGIKYD
jgi:hypothetical protein